MTEKYLEFTNSKGEKFGVKRPNKKVQQQRSRINKNIKDGKKTCLFPGCNSKAIGSHLLQRNGVLHLLAEDEHIYLYRINSYSLEIEFERRSIGKPASKKLFCSHHDSSIFHPIEKHDVQWHLYDSQLLVSYRALCGELRTIMDHLEASTAEHQVTSIRRHIGRSKLEYDIFVYRGTIEILKVMKSAMESYLFQRKSGEKFFYFSMRELPSVGRACCSLFSDPQLGRAGANAVSSYTGNTRLDTYKGEPALFSPLVFMTLLPTVQGSIAIYGNYVQQGSDLRVKQLDKMRQGDFLMEIDELLIGSIENWICSPSYYRNHILPSEVEISRTIRQRSVFDRAGEFYRPKGWQKVLNLADQARHVDR